MSIEIELEETLRSRIIISDFGIDNGVQTFRINGLKDDLEYLVGQLFELGVKFDQHPSLTECPTHRLWSLLLKITIPR